VAAPDTRILAILAGAGQPPRAAAAAREFAFERRHREAPLLTPGPGSNRNYRHEHGLAADAEAEELGRIARAMASAEAGRLVPLADITEWFDSLGTDYILPLPRARRWGDRMRPAGSPTLTDEAAQSLGQIEWWYSQPGTGAVPIAIRRVRAILAAIDRVVDSPDSWLRGRLPETREALCQQHRIVYQMVACDDLPPAAANVVILEIFGPAPG
jgi:plasmid stabilization system protein ParE